jgi:hypothetical protein
MSLSLVVGFGFLIGIAVLVITVVVIVSILQNNNIDNNNKIFWIAMILLFNFIGLIVYLLVNDKNVLK